MSSQKNTIDIYKPRDNFAYMALKNASWGVMGLFLGIVINNSIIYLTNELNITILLIQNILQILFCAITLSLLNNYFHVFGWSWQATTEGVFFVSFFFGVQYKLLNNIQNTYILNDKNK
jgi:hypothetical protein